MALPTISSVTPNGGVVVGGTKVVIAGTNFIGTTSVYFGSAPAATFKVESATEITATSPATASGPGFVGNVSGAVNVIVTNATGSNAVEAGAVFVYWPSVLPKSEADRTFETVALGAVKGTSSPVSYLTAAGAESKYVYLRALYDNIAYLAVQISPLELLEAPKIKVVLEDSIDGGVTYFPTTGFTETAELTTTPIIQRVSLAESPFGPNLRFNLKFGAKGGVAGSIVVASSTAKALSK